MDNFKFNNGPSHTMHIDLNSCFATIEQQANPLLRGKPVVVAAFTSPGGCILASSIEAKKLGIKTGMRVRDGLDLYKNLIILPSDPHKYRDVHLKLRKIVSDYTNDFSPKSIDEFVLNLRDYSVLKETPLKVVAQEIKKRIRCEIGEWLTVSVGIAPNRYLAKIAAGLNKPDGLDEINRINFLDIYSKLKLTDLTGIKKRNELRLNSMGIMSVLDFYNAPIWKKRAAFHSITGAYWHMRLSGFEIDDVEFARRSYGNSVAIGKNLTTTRDLSPILARLTEKTCSRLRRAGYKAAGVHLSILYKDGSYWHKGSTLAGSLFDARDVYKKLFHLLFMGIKTGSGKTTPVLNLAVSVFNLTRVEPLQLDFFDDVKKRKSLVEAIDKINERWGSFSLGMARSFKGENMILDRIAFGGIKELEEFTLD
jgi:DNA polymerase IV